MKSLPTISIVIATFNSSRTLGLCLRKIKEQDYPQDLIEIVTADGGSIDNTREIAKRYGARVIDVPKDKQNAEYNKGVGFQNAKNEIVLLLDHDNIMPHEGWIKKIIRPLMENPEVIGSEPLRFHYDKKMTVLDRYIALFGGSDPVVYYFGKNSHLSYATDKYNLFGKSQDKGYFYEITYSSDNIPALAGNGAAFRRKDLINYATTKPQSFIHTDIAAQLIRGGHNKYALVKDSIIHLTNNKVFPFLSRRKYFVEKYQLDIQYNRKYKIYDPKKDKAKLLMYILFSVTIIIPLLDSVRGFLKIRDFSWFLHPFMCIAFLFIYSVPVFKGGVRNVLLEK